MSELVDERKIGTDDEYTPYQRNIRAAIHRAKLDMQQAVEIATAKLLALAMSDTGLTQRAYVEDVIHLMNIREQIERTLAKYR